MEGDRPWAAPAEYVVVGRRWTYAPPPWVMYEAVVDDMELRIEQHGHGSAITVLAYGAVPQLPDETRRLVRHRLGTIFGAALREWVDEPH